MAKKRNEKWRITQSSWDKYRKKVRALGDKAEEMLTGMILGERAEGLIYDMVVALVNEYGEGSAALACELYDTIAAMSGKNVPPAEPAPIASQREIKNAIIGESLRTDSPEAIASVAGRYVRRASLDTMLKNALRDGAEFAWVPSGDSCAFCLMLASNGWQKASKEAIEGGHADHIHNNCDCNYVVRFSDDMTVEGYDPDKLYDEYMSAGNTQSERINALRRQHYAANKDTINAQKRVAYAKRKAIDNGRGGGYNNSPADDELRRRYERDVKTGWISPLCGLDNYKNIFREIESRTVGLKVKGNTIITGQSEHFTTRVVGTSIDPARIVNNVYSITGTRPQGYRSNARSGVEIADILEALQSGRASELRDENGKLSRRYTGSRCIVTVNPETGMLIQCNPKRK